jgi:two-component system response regulator FlrC
VRELENVLQRAMLLRAGDRIEPDDLTIEAGTLSAQGKDGILAPAAAATTRLTDAVRLSEAQAIEEALAATGGHRVRAAERLGISERTLRYRLAGMRSAA